MRTFIATLACATLAGCAGSNFFYNDLLSSRNLTIDEVDASAGLYRVNVMNTSDFGWDGDERADREKAIAFLLADKCARTEIVSDNAIEMGAYTLTTKKRVKHSMVVRCART